MKRLVLMLLLYVPFAILADEPDTRFCLGGCPIGAPPTDRVVNHHILTLSLNPTTKFADWVAYVVTIDSKSGGKRPRNFKGDPSVPDEEELEKSDYNGGYDAIHINKGHQAPLASFSGSPFWYETNYLTNVTPQQNDLNKGPWKRLEEAVRELADWGYPVYVMTGPLYERQIKPLPNADEPHRVPSGYWKIVATFEEGEYWSAAFILDQNSPIDSSHCLRASTIWEVEDRTGLDFFTKLGFENELEIETGNNDLLPWLGCENMLN